METKTNKKIDLVVKKAGKRFYLCSTNQSKTCKEAVRKFLAKHNQTNYVGTCGTWYIDNNVSAQFDHKNKTKKQKTAQQERIARWEKAHS